MKIENVANLSLLRMFIKVPRPFLSTVPCSKFPLLISIRFCRHSPYLSYEIYLWDKAIFMIVKVIFLLGVKFLKGEIGS